MDLDFQSSHAGEYVQSLRLERNHVPVGTGLLRTTGGALIAGDEVYRCVFHTTFGTPPSHIHRRRIAFITKCHSGLWTSATANLGNIPNAPGKFARHYIRARGVVELFPNLSLIQCHEVDEQDTPFGTIIGLSLGGLSGIQTSFPLTTFTQERDEDLGNLNTDYQHVGPLVNLGPDSMAQGAFYIDRIIACSSPTNGSVLRVSVGGSNWFTFGPHFVNGTTQEGLIETPVPDPGIGIDFRNRYGNNASLLFKNDELLNAPSLIAPYSPMVVLSPTDNIRYVQYLQVIYLGSVFEPALSDEEIFEVTPPRNVTA